MSQHGDLVVAGGATFQYDLTTYPVGYQELGARWLFMLDLARPSQPFPPPPAQPVVAALYPNDVGFWRSSLFPLHTSRYYPTVTLSHGLSRLNGQEVVIVSGGSDPNATTNDPRNTYETWRVDVSTVPGFLATDSSPDQPGPGTAGPIEVDWLQEYPRQFTLSDGRVISTGPAYKSAKINLDGNLGGAWETGVGQGGTNWPSNRHDGSNVFFAKLGAITDCVVRVCGSGPLGKTDKAEFLLATASPPTPPGSTSWLPLSSGADQVPPRPRTDTNAIILPDAAIVVLGGSDSNDTSVLDLALFQQGVGWTQLPATANLPTPRNYHATAVLLPDGRVFVADGEGRHTGSDYDIMRPHYLQGSPLRPVISSISGTGVALVDGTWHLNYGSTVFLLKVEDDSLHKLDSLAKIVLMAPGAITHHSDMTARYVELTSQMVPGKPHQRQFVLPGNTTLPRGYYMCFALNTANVPSVATWVRIQ